LEPTEIVRVTNSTIHVWLLGVGGGEGWLLALLEASKCSHVVLLRLLLIKSTHCIKLLLLLHIIHLHAIIHLHPVHTCHWIHLLTVELLHTIINLVHSLHAIHIALHAIHIALHPIHGHWYESCFLLLLLLLLLLLASIANLLSAKSIGLDIVKSRVLVISRMGIGLIHLIQVLDVYCLLVHRGCVSITLSHVHLILPFLEVRESIVSVGCLLVFTSKDPSESILIVTYLSLRLWCIKIQ